MVAKRLISLPSDHDDDDILQDIRDLVGDEAADELQAAAAGTKISLPRAEALTEEHTISQMVGFETAKAICEAVVPGSRSLTRILIPLGNTGLMTSAKRRVEELLIEDGYSANEIARIAGVHIRTVHRYRASQRAKGKRIGDPLAPRSCSSLPEHFDVEARIIERLLMDGFAPAILRQLLRVPPKRISLIRNDLIKEGKLKC